MKCKFCGKETPHEKYLSTNAENITCGKCTTYCTKKCEIGKSGKTQGFHFEPCLTCDKNPYNLYK